MSINYLILDGGEKVIGIENILKDEKPYIMELYEDMYESLKENRYDIDIYPDPIN